MEQEIKYDAFGIKKGTKGLVVASSIIELIIGILGLIASVGILCMGVMFLVLGDAWAQSIFDALGVYGMIGAITGVVIAIGCLIAFALVLTVGLLMTLSGSKCLKAVRNPLTLIDARGRILGYGIFYAVLVGLSIIGLITAGATGDIFMSLISEALLAVVAVLKIVAASMLPKNSLIAGQQGYTTPQVPPQYYQQNVQPVQPQTAQQVIAPAEVKAPVKKATATKKATPTKKMSAVKKTSTAKPATKTTTKKPSAKKQ